ncbi:RNA polymerase subunit sigma-70 [Virgisporangium aurantiacum]|uniref:DNA-directed RNA polymerase sigma-70 factor n=1 Tax=Virgisporangium aurantiacum TaxID=175570 RepID=A0A8J4E6N4_9ACTN|nr:RNA polymerase subunit sigma-70 [Virgisporangium aurantiacum]GIJ63414.1 DNA-directed RNA polymerase sigma-70 factor [Virgisporangium aurantiacum]
MTLAVETELAQEPAQELARQLAELRRPLLGFCYRMLGSSHDAEDAVQETMIRAWRGLGRLDDRSGLRPWVFRIATNVCVDAANDRRRRALPMDIAAPDDGRGMLGTPQPESVWISPVPSWKVDPADLAVSRDSIRLAFIAALQHLAPRQRAVLILRDVLRWRAAEVATLLDTTVDAVHSALRRARAALSEARRDSTANGGQSVDEPVDARLLQRYVDAFERYDIDGIVSLLHHDVVVSMPPYAFWLRGSDVFGRWLRARIAPCDNVRMLRTDANGVPATALYKNGWKPVGLHVPEWRDGKIAALHAFLDPAIFTLFELPARPEG